MLLLLRWASRSPPHQSPPVTASPQGEASGLCSPTRKKRSKSGYADGHRNSPSTVPLRPTTPKPASGNERAINQGGRGPSPATLCVRAFSRESLDPRPGPGGNPPRRCQPAPVQTRTTYQGQPGAAYPLGGCLRSHLGAQRPVAPPARRGSPFLPRNGEKEGRGQAPWTPGFYGRSFPLAGFGVGWLWYGRRAVASGMLSPIWDAFSRKNMLKSILRKEGFQIGRIPPKPSPRGEGAPVRTLGRMRGRPGCPTGQEKKGVGATGPSFYKERLGTESPPHPSPSVTASPQGEAFVGATPPQRNSFLRDPCSRKMRIQIRARTWVP